MGAIVAANWKMNLARDSAGDLASRLARDGRECWLFPAFPLLETVAAALRGSRLRLGAQDLSPEKDGAFTGDVSAAMLRDAGCSLVLVGHSERRHGHGERAELLLQKLQAAVAAGLMPLYCVGETLAERDASRADEIMGAQLRLLAELTEAERSEVAAVAYEPVWAIGTGRTATARQAEEMHGKARAVLVELGMGSTPLLYGGSAKPDNSAELIGCEHVDGLLVGGASLKYESLAAIDDIAREG